jgi:uncharacterized repeat protein (TIGR04076 family)
MFICGSLSFERRNAMNPSKVRITVVKKTFNEDLVELYTDGRSFKPSGCCHDLAIGQSFETTGHAPEGLPDWAWCDMQKYVMTLARGGNFLGCKPGIFVTCCTDGFRPVFYKLERIEE